MKTDLPLKNDFIPARRPSVRRRILAGTAIVIALGGSLAAISFAESSAAFAQPVVINQPVQLPTFADLVSQVTPSVVAIRVQGMSPVNVGGGNPGFGQMPQGSPQPPFFQGPQTAPTEALGSGFFVSADGYIVTNNHVVQGATSVTVILQDGTQYPAHLIGTDPVTDLALVKVDANQQFPYLTFADTPAKIGDWAIAVGNPLGLYGSVTAGIVSGLGRQISNNAYDDYMQIDAAVNEGNSGGPTFNLAGQVIGINTAIYSSTGGNIGIAFDVPADVAAKIIGDLRDHGSVTRGWLGLQIQSINTQLAGLLGLDQATGVLVAEPIAGDPAAQAGIQTRDVITAINGAAVGNADDFSRQIGGLDPGTTVDLTVIRSGHQMDISVTLGTMPTTTTATAQASTPPTPAEVGLGLQVGTDNNGAITVIGINPDGTAAAAGLQQGDVLVSVDDQTIGNFTDLQTAVDAARSANHPAMLFEIQRNGSVLFVAVNTWVNQTNTVH